MIEKAWLTVMALAAAYLLVTLIPGLAPEVSARTADKIVVAQPTTAEGSSATECTESWPYYQPACLRDSRQPGGLARTVRIISTERSGVESSGSPAL
jgi:hypothetical protein